MLPYLLRYKCLKISHCNNYFKHSIEFQILCPIRGCSDIKANGHDSNFVVPMQFYFCKNHHTSFYAHTSWLPKLLAQIVIQRVLLRLFLGSVSATALAQEFHMTASTLSNLVNHCQDYVDNVILRINQQNKAIRKELPKLVQDAVWIDEPFFSVNGLSWSLILAIDYTGQVLGCQFGRERKATQIIEVLKQVEQSLPNWQVLIGDGARAYTPAVRSFEKDVYLLQQYHSKPWELASLSHFCPASDGSMLEHQVQLSYRVFMEDSLQVGSVLTRKHAKRTKKVGRPKGSKTRRQKGDKTRKKATPKKRAPKSAWNDGVAFFVGDEANFWIFAGMIITGWKAKR